VIVDVPPVPVCVSVRVADSAEVVVGVWPIVNMQVPPAATAVVHPVTEKSEALAPEIAAAEMVRLEELVLVTVTACALAATPGAVDAKVNELLDNVGFCNTVAVKLAVFVVVLA
jgi:hypothetical protein